MSRITRGVTASKRRNKVLKAAKGFKWRRSSTYKAAKQALMKAGKYAYRDRKNKKRTFRRLWILRLNNALRELGLKYSTFIKDMSEKKIELDRKVLSQMAVENPETFKKFIEKVK
ncbi:50S ribosomal protein L20 [bacterium]|jgi:large subunit ribosomal protein L20|nr:50S ribosomal protein L20 [bacterium]MBT4251371.1 50S ribosomal protein L20 [bacterium]MBT4598248.1 50S ribosomal protein L20 [bacterium]MBT6754081.1 50S ribosomal protein L20 [bacterium]MBT7037901.1 50S ribosomal protein L20 [bacterium]